MPDFSPTVALADPIVRLYLALAVGVLLAAGVAIGVLKLLGRDVTHPWASYRGWLAMIPLILGSIVLGRLAAIGFFTLVAAMAFKEYARATGLYRDWGYAIVGYAGILAVGVVAMVDDPGKGVAGWYGLFMALPVFVIAGILVLPIVRNRAKGQLQYVALAIVGFVYIGWMFGHLTFLFNADRAYGCVLYLLFAVQVNDVAAYTFGKLLGRHPLRSNISPKKTWEGSLGALAVSMALPWLLRFSLPGFGPLELVLTGLIVGIGGQLGDLSMSAIKRDLEVKDMGALITGHGGVLDRIDSLIYSAPLFFHMVRYLRGIY